MFYCTVPVFCTDPSTYFAFQAKGLNSLHVFSYQDRFAAVTGMSEIPDEMAWITETCSSDYHLNLQTERSDLQLRTYSLTLKYLTLRQFWLSLMIFLCVLGQYVEFFREIGGISFIYNLAKSSTFSQVKETALFTLASLAELHGVYTVTFIYACVYVCGFIIYCIVK